MPNTPIEHFFHQGMKSDLDQHLKTKDSYVFGLNGRLFSKDGSLGFHSIAGTKEILNDESIVRYLGAVSFRDELIVFAKCSGVDVNVGGVIYETEEVRSVVAQTFDVELSSEVFAFSDEFSDNSDIIVFTENVANPAPDLEIELDDNYDPENSTDQEIDYATYYALNYNVPVFASCSLTEESVPVNNADYADCIISIKQDENGNFFSRPIWSGYQNWPLYGKIVALGVDENSNYRRVKYTDFTNSFKSINVYDKKLYKRTPEELENFQSSILLQPRILSIDNNGQLNSMAVQYFYRLITENGQVTEFSPASKVTYIVPESGQRYRGGAPQEKTDKSVKLVCNVVDPTNFQEIECVALEFESATVPTTIRSLGTKEVASVVEFDHFGNEPEYLGEITLNDIVSISANWKYCSDLETKNNTLYAFGLRNDPISADFNRLEKLFALHGWDTSGNTHTSFLNPDPVQYSHFPPNYTDKLFYSKKRTIANVKAFGDITITFTDSESANSRQELFDGQELRYSDITESIWNWLEDLQNNDANFLAHFPNLEISFEQGVILFAPIDGNVSTDMSRYSLSFDTQQVILEVEDEDIFFNTSPGSQQYVQGAMSAGFNSGTGIRLSYLMEEEDVATQATERYAGNGKILDFEEPSFDRGFMKGEIYRVAIQLYRNGERLFSIPLGDIKIPDIGDDYAYMDTSGNLVTTTDKYLNQKTVGNKLKAVKVKIRAEFRMDCEFSKDIDSFQILYVERTENNRTILAQGISAPLMRLQDPVHFLGGRTINEKILSKWTLPYYGGPVYGREGFDIYDTEGGEHEEPTYDHLKRVINDRSLFYLDCPDVVYGKISESLLKSSKIDIVGKLNTDHNSDTVMISGEPEVTGYPVEQFPKFSRKVTKDYIESTIDITDYPQLALDENADNVTWNTKFFNFSVFSNFTFFNQQHNIEGIVQMKRGETIPGTDLNTAFSISNNAFCAPSMPWWFSEEVRNMRIEDDQYGFEALTVSNISTGERTLFVKTTEDAFTNALIGASNFNSVESQIRRGNNNYEIYDTHALMNVFRNNRNSVYGGRTKQAFSQNVFVPLSETIPVDKKSNASQVFTVNGDTYTTLWMRTKNSYGDDPVGELDRDINNGRTSTAANRGDLLRSNRVNGSWCYAVVLETTVEPKLNDEYEFYRESGAIDFNTIKKETLNSAYLHTNNIKKHIPRPFRYRDDPNFTNIIAASETKISGEYYDSWSSFPVNEFQELDKNGGAVLNAAKEKNEIYAIQERQTSLLFIDRDVMIPSESGTAINLKQGAGKKIDGYEIISRFGTSIRRSVVKNTDFGFTFVDERLKAFVKMNMHINLESQFHHDFYDKYNFDNIVDANGYFDEQFKETVIGFELASGENIAIAYSEVAQSITGYYQYDAPIYMMHNGKVYAPKEKMITVGENIVPSSQSLKELNAGNHLELFENNREMELSFVSAPQTNLVSIFAHVALILQNDTKIKDITFTTKQGLSRQILSDHFRYKVREGIHSVPLLNEWFDGIDPLEEKDLRSEWVHVRIRFNHNDGNPQGITKVVNYIRKSYN